MEITILVNTQRFQLHDAFESDLGPRKHGFQGSPPTTMKSYVLDGTCDGAVYIIPRERCTREDRRKRRGKAMARAYDRSCSRGQVL